MSVIKHVVVLRNTLHPQTQKHHSFSVSNTSFNLSIVGNVNFLMIYYSPGRQGKTNQFICIVSAFECLMLKQSRELEENKDHIDWM